MPMTNATPEQLELARKILKDNFGTTNGLGVKIALAAIIETTERAAKWIVSQTDSNDPFGIHEDIAEALRNQEHLKND